jgi:hypothetical protein
MIIINTTGEKEGNTAKISGKFVERALSQNARGRNGVHGKKTRSLHRYKGNTHIDPSIF